MDPLPNGEFDWTKYAPMVERQRPYLRSHPLAYFFTLGIALTGMLSLLGFTQQDSAALVLPDWLQTGFQICWSVGGAASFFGIASRRRAFEALGAVFIGGGLLVLTATILYLDPTTQRVASLAFVIALSIGCFLRAAHLAFNEDPYACDDLTDLTDLRAEADALLAEARERRGA